MSSVRKTIPVVHSLCLATVVPECVARCNSLFCALLFVSGMKCDSSLMTPAPPTMYASGVYVLGVGVPEHGSDLKLVCVLGGNRLCTGQALSAVLHGPFHVEITDGYTQRLQLVSFGWCRGFARYTAAVLFFVFSCIGWIHNHDKDLVLR